MSIILRNASKVGFFRVFARLIGLLSTFVVARLLTPNDYAVIAICMIVQDLAYRLEDIGLNSNLISKKLVSTDFEKSLITIKLIVGFLLFIAVYASSSFLAAFFNDIRIELVLQVISFVFLIKPLSNLRLTLEVKKENFNPTLKAMLLSKFISSCLTVFFAYYFGNYWALAFGILSSSFLYVVISYLVATPYFYFRWAQSEIKDVFSFSKWFTLKQLIEFVNAKSTIFFIGKIFDSNLVGFFSLGNQICMMPGQEVSASIDQANMSSLAKERNKGLDFKEQLLRNMKLNLTAKTLLLSPIYAAFCVYSETIILILLGENWAGLGFYFQFFAISAFLISLGSSYTSYLLLYRSPKVVSFISAFVFMFRLSSLVIVFFYESILLLLFFSVFLNFSRNLIQMFFLDKKEPGTFKSFICFYFLCILMFFFMAFLFLCIGFFIGFDEIGIVVSLLVTPMIYFFQSRIYPNSYVAFEVNFLLSIMLKKLNVR